MFFTKKIMSQKKGITFAYKLGLKSFLYEKVSERKVTFEFNDPRSFWQILESQNSKGKMQFFDILLLCEINYEIRITYP
jgi:hypothetical protein